MGLQHRLRRGDALHGTHTTHVVHRWPGRVVFESFHGHGSGPAFASGPVVVAAPGYAASDAMPLHVGLWLFRGHPPAGAVEVIVKEVTFTPLEETAGDPVAR